MFKLISLNQVSLSQSSSSKLKHQFLQNLLQLWKRRTSHKTRPLQFKLRLQIIKIAQLNQQSKLNLRRTLQLQPLQRMILLLRLKSLLNQLKMPLQKLLRSQRKMLQHNQQQSLKRMLLHNLLLSQRKIQLLNRLQSQRRMQLVRLKRHHNQLSKPIRQIWQSPRRIQALKHKQLILKRMLLLLQSLRLSQRRTRLLLLHRIPQRRMRQLYQSLKRIPLLWQNLLKLIRLLLLHLMM